MGFFSSLFKPPTPAPKPPSEAQIVRKSNGVAVDLFWVERDHAAVTAQLRKVADALHGEPISMLIWVIPDELLHYYLAPAHDEQLRELVHSVGLISQGRRTVMLFMSPPPAHVRALLLAQGITAAPET